MNYLAEIWNSRYFWTHLARADLRARFRQSRLGLLWALLQPVGVALLITFVFCRVFNTPWQEFAPFVLSGVLIWDFVMGAVLTGCHAFPSAAAYIKQQKLPIVIYPLRNTLGNFIVFLVGFGGMLAMALAVGTKSIGWPLLSLVPALAIYVLLAWALSIIAAFVNTRFRDFQYLAPVLIQALYFVSPVFLEEKAFAGTPVGAILNANPITHVMRLVRAPVLHGCPPAGISWLIALGLLLALWLLAFFLIRHEEDTIVFFL